MQFYIIKLKIIIKKPGTFFGFKGFYAGIPREMKLQSSKIAHLLYLEFDDFYNVIKKNR